MGISSSRLRARTTLQLPVRMKQNSQIERGNHFRQFDRVGESGWCGCLQPSLVRDRFPRHCPANGRLGPEQSVCVRISRVDWVPCAIDHPH